jgi:hypothetical protein
MAAEVTFGDLTTTQVAILGGILAVPIAGQSRAQMLTLIGGVPGYQWVVEDANVRQLTVVHLRQWATAMGIAGGMNMHRPEIVRRLLEMAMPPAPPAPAPVPVPVAPPVPQEVRDPRPVTIAKLENFSDQMAYYNWKQEITNACQLRGVWTFPFEPLLTTPTNAAENAISAVLNPYQGQMLLVIKQAVKNSLTKSIRDAITPLLRNQQINDSAAAIVKWVTARVENLQPAMHERNLVKFKNATWKTSKGDLTSFVGRLESMADACGDLLPFGVPRDYLIRKMIIENCTDRDKAVSHVCLKYQTQPVTAAGMGYQDLVEELTRVMTRSDSKGEAQCEIYCADVTTPDEADRKIQAFTTQVNQLQSEKAKLKQQLAKGNNESAGAANVQVNYASGKGHWKNKPGNASSSSTNTGNKHCPLCAKHYKERGLDTEDRAKRVIASHNKWECWFKAGGKERGKGAGKGDKDKGNKKKKGKGKGKKNAKGAFKS